MIRPPTVELAMDRFLIIEVMIAPINRQLGRRNGDEDGARPPLDDFMAFAWGNDDDFMPEAGGGAQLRVDVGPHATARWRVEGTYVDNSHAGEKPGNALNLK